MLCFIFLTLDFFLQAVFIRCILKKRVRCKRLYLDPTVSVCCFCMFRGDVSYLIQAYFPASFFARFNIHNIYISRYKPSGEHFLLETQSSFLYRCAGSPFGVRSTRHCFVLRSATGRGLCITYFLSRCVCKHQVPRSSFSLS